LGKIESVSYCVSERVGLERLEKNPAVVGAENWIKLVHTVESKGRHLHGSEAISGTIDTK